MKTIILLILSAFTAFAATTYPVLTDNPLRTFSGGGTNLALLNGTNVLTGTNTFTAWSDIRTGAVFHVQSRLLFYTNFNSFTFYPYTNAGAASASNAPSSYYFIVTNASVLPVTRPATIGFQVGYRRKNTSGTTETSFANVWSGTALIYSPLITGSGGARGSFGSPPGAALFYTPDGTNLFYNQPNGSSSIYTSPATSSVLTNSLGPISGVDVSAPWLFSIGTGYNTASVTEDSPLTMEYLAVWETPLFYP